jgi:hypothetical protein
MYARKRRVARPIYGGNDNINTEQCVSDSIYLDLLNNLLTTVENVVAQFFPNFTGYANVVGEMTATTAVPPSLFTRFIWARENADQKYTNSERQQYDVIDIYLRYALDWKADKFLTVSIPDSSGPIAA